jgi:Flp pilus assembly protein TadG
MNKLHQNEKGFMSIMLMVIAALLLIMAGMTFKVTKAMHRRNRKEKTRIQQRADKIIIRNSAQCAISVVGKTK